VGQQAFRLLAHLFICESVLFSPPSKEPPVMMYLFLLMHSHAMHFISAAHTIEMDVL